MIGFLYQLASTVAHVAAYAGRSIAEGVGIISDPWEWATVHLMGQKTLYGQVRRSNASIEVMGFDPDNSDIPRQTFHGWSAVYSVDIASERDVRRAYVEGIAGRGHGACDSWSPSSVCPDLCRTCAFEQEYHWIALADAARVQRFADMIRETIDHNGAVVHMRGEDGATYDGRNGPIEYVSVVIEGIARQLTADEWEKARQAGVRLGPYGSQDPPEDGDGHDEDIPW